jgi:hypothetical protein
MAVLRASLAPNMTTPRLEAIFAASCRTIAGLLLLAVVSCGEPPESTSATWFRDIGKAGDTARCVRIATALRAECQSDADCARAVTFDLTYHCYAGVYAAGSSATTSQSDLGPCFLEVDSSADRDIERAAGSYCEGLDLPKRSSDGCRAELQLVLSELCLMGDPALTGAGP